MRCVKLLLFLLLVGAVVFSCDDDTSPTLPPATPGGGFIVATYTNVDNEGPIAETAVAVAGNWQEDLPGAAGDATPFNVTTNSLGLAAVQSARAPAEWTFTWISSEYAPAECNGVTATNDIPLNSTQAFTCLILTGSESASIVPSSFSLSPNPVYISSAPSSGTVFGSGISSTYGMPLVQYYTLDGTLVAQENATSVSSDGTSMQISGFSITQLPVGTYAAFVSNAASGGGYTYLGTGAVELADGGVDIVGDEQSTQKCVREVDGGDCLEWETIYDEGTVSVTVNGVVSSVTYDETSTPYTLAVALASAINSNASVNSLVYALAAGTSVLTNSQSGAQYSLSATAASRDTTFFPYGSFTPEASSSIF